MSDKYNHECMIGVLHRGYADEIVSYAQLKKYFDIDLASLECYTFFYVSSCAKYFKMAFDRRSGRMAHFDYCPFCGEKINWQEIRKSAKKYAESKQKFFTEGGKQNE